MDFIPENQKQEEAFELASQLCNVLNEGVQKKLLEQVGVHNFATNSKLINATVGSKGVYVDTNGISKL